VHKKLFLGTALFFTEHTRSLSEASFHLYTNTRFLIPETNTENKKNSVEL